MSIGFEKAYALQTDMNLPASEILSTYVYRIGLLNGDYGYSTAVGLFQFSCKCYLADLCELGC